MVPTIVAPTPGDSTRIYRSESDLLPHGPGAPSPEPAAPLLGERVLAIGDSLMAQTTRHLAPRLEILGATQRVLGVGGSGLLSTKGVDWKTTAAGLVAGFHPSIVVVEFCCNYPKPYMRDGNGHEILPGTDAFKRQWALAAAELADILTSSGARLYWVITPPALGDASSVVNEINATTWEATARADPPIRLIRWDHALTAGTGEFRDSILVGGRAEVVREPDHLHLTEAGGELAANSVIDALLADSPQAWAPFGDPVEMVLQVQRDLTGKPDDVAAAEVVAARLHNGDGDRTRFVTDLARGTHWGGVVEPLVRLHLALDGVPPDHLSLRAAIDRARAGTSLVEEARRLLGTDGGGRLAGGDTAFLDHIQRTAFGDALTRPDREALVLDLAGGTSRAEVVTRIARSPRFIARSNGAVRTIALYEGLLRRAPTEGELALWSPLVSQDRSEGLVNHLLQSDAYAARLPAARRTPIGPGVVGGYTLGSDDVPWLVALVERGADPGDGILCAGALIHRSWVVTTANCVLGQRVGALDVMVGGTGRRDATVGASWIYVSPEFDSATMTNDVALIELSRPVPASPIEVGNIDGDAARAVVGWSRSDDGSAGAPQLADLGPISDADCARAHGPAFHQESMRCAGLLGGGVDACQGGAPLVAGTGSRRRLVGLVSWGSGCARPNAPAVAVRLHPDDAMLELGRYRPPHPSPAEAVVSLYLAVESRLPTDREKLEWTDRLTTRQATEADLVAALVRSGDRRSLSEPPTRMWMALTGSPPIVSDVAFWTEDLAKGKPLRWVTDRMKVHPLVASGLEIGDDHTYVVATHLRILGRTPDDLELIHRLDDLTTGRGTRADLALDLARGEEGAAYLRVSSEIVVSAMTLLGRMPTDHELLDWTGRLREGAPLRDVVHEILESEEMANLS